MESGLRGLTIEEITKRSGVAKTTIYRRWSGAEEVAIRAIKCGFVAGTDEIQTLGSFREDLRAHFDVFLTMTEDVGFRRVMLSLMNASVANPELAEVRAEMDATRLDVVRDMVEAARARGEITRDLTLDQISAIIEGPLFIMRVHSMVEVTDADIDAIIDAICAALA